MNYKACTRAIGETNALIWDNLAKIEKFVEQNMHSKISGEVQIGQIMEGMDPLDSFGVPKAIQFIEEALSANEILRESKK